MSIFETVVDFFTKIIGEYLSVDYLLYITLGIFVFFLIIVFIKSSSSYEVRATKAIDKLNTYLVANPYINEENLLLFNKKIKSVPKIIRYQWQHYVLNRDKAPSNYMSRDNCVEKPLKSSSYHGSIKLLKNVTVILSIVTFLLGLIINLNVIKTPSGTSYNTYVYFVSMVLFRSSLIPAVMLIISELFTIFLRSRLNNLTSSLYQIFYDFERNIDKATTTLPDYIDYEMLFTKQEIKSGIPILQEYLDKRDRQQQEELKKAMAREIEHEKYDFDSTGIDGSLLLERAMKESELFIVNRKRLIAEIEQLQTEQENNKKNFDMATKEVNRKLQATKENLIKFKAQQEQSTNRIETNYIRKQQAEEVRKQQQLERDLEEAIKKFDEAQASIEREIESRNAEIEENRKYIEEAMIAEFDTFSEKTYKILYDSVETKLVDKIEEINNSTQEQKLRIEELEKELQDKQQITQELASTKEQFENLQKAYEQNQRLYDELLVKFTAMNGGEINVKNLVSNVVDNNQLESAKEEILNAIKNLVISVPAVKEPAKKKEVKAEQPKEEPAQVKEEKPAEQPKVEEQPVEEPKQESVVEADKKPKRKAKKVDSGEDDEKEVKPAPKKKTTSKAKKPATSAKTNEQTEEKIKAKSAQDEELKKKRAEARKKKREEEAKRKAEALQELQRRIEEENSKLSKQQDELNKVINSTIDAINQVEEKPKTRKKAAKKVAEEKPAEQPVEEPKQDVQEPAEVPQNNEEGQASFNNLQELFNKISADNQ